MKVWEAAYTDWQAGMKYREIAAKYGVSESTVKSWATRYFKGKKEKPTQKKVAKKSQKNPSERLQPAAKKSQPRGAPLGNQNAKGNRGGGAPRGNQNHRIHGIYSAAFSDEVRQLLAQRETCSEIEQMESLILFWESRELLILREINSYRENPAGMAIQSVAKTGNKTTSIATSTFDRLAYWERLLTSVQREHTRCLMALYKMKQIEGGEGNENLEILMQSIDAAREKWGEPDDTVEAVGEEILPVHHESD